MSRLNASFGDLADRFDSLFDDVEDLTRREALSLDAILRPRGVRCVLDCACGTGIQALGLAELGYQVSASDLSRRMLDRLREKARARGLEIEVRSADFRDLMPWRGRRFDAVICCGNSLPLVSDGAEVGRSLESMRGVVRRDGGVAVVGLHNYARPWEEGHNFLFRRAECRGGDGECSFDLREFAADRVAVTHFFLRARGGRWKTMTVRKSYLNISPEEIASAMTGAGYRNVHLLDSRGLAAYRGDEWFFAVGES